MKKRYFIPEGNYFQKLYPNLWMLTIAPSGNFKTTALKKGGRLALKKEGNIRKELANISENDEDKAKEIRKILSEIACSFQTGYIGRTSSTFGRRLRRHDQCALNLENG
jgi:hypothetical protein